MASALAHAGAHVVLWARRDRALSQVASTLQGHGGEILPQRVDVTDPQAVRAATRHALRRFGRVDVLVNNAGIWAGDPVVTLRADTWSKVLRTNLTSVVRVSQAILPAMIRQRHGRIINVSSVSGLLAQPDGAAYGSAKAALIHLTRIMAVELGRSGIRVNGIAPGLFRTSMTADVFEDRRWVARRRRQVPLGRFGEPEDLAGLIVFLAGPGSDYLTGQTIVVDGGASLCVGR